MGHIWRDKSVDYGIDGEIELIDAGEVLNRVLWVQSKAQGKGRKFAGETETGFRYTCSEADLYYWLSGTAPVLLVCSHPETNEAWFKHLPSWFDDPRRRRDRHVEFDKAVDRFDASAARKLLALSVDATCGVYLSPPPRRETLTTNLLAVEHLADRVHVAPTKCRRWTDANPRLIKAGHNLISDVVFHGGNLYSFRPMDEPPLDALTDGPPESIGTDGLADSADESDQLVLRWLLNATLKDLTHRDLRMHPDAGYLYFKAPANGKDKKVKVGRGSGRTVVQRYEPAEGAAWVGYTRHYALEHQFIYADGGWYLALTPTYHFTSDGREDSPFAGTQLATIKRIEGHEAVRSQTAFWARYLSWSPSLFSSPPDRRLRFADLLKVDVDRGIDDKAWKPRPDNDMGEVEETLDTDDQPLTLFGVDEEDDA